MDNTIVVKVPVNGRHREDFVESDELAEMIEFFGAGNDCEYVIDKIDSHFIIYIDEVDWLTKEEERISVTLPERLEPILVTLEELERACEVAVQYLQVFLSIKRLESIQEVELYPTLNLPIGEHYVTIDNMEDAEYWDAYLNRLLAFQ